MRVICDGDKVIAPMTSISVVFRLDNDDIHICFKDGSTYSLVTKTEDEAKEVMAHIKDFLVNEHDELDFMSLGKEGQASE